MAAPAVKRMTIAEFLEWNPPGDTRYQLVDGVPVAMAPHANAHGQLAATLCTELTLATRRRPPCFVVSQPGIALWHRDTCYEADLAVACRPQDPKRHDLADPILIVEVLSPTTERHDQNVKLPDYRRLPSVQEIVLIDSRSMVCHVHRRQPDGRWLTDILQQPEERLVLDSCAFDQPLSALYANVALEE